MSTKMLIGYARVSTDEQSLDMQRSALEAAGCDRIYEDAGVSGATTQRLGLTAALATLQRGDTFVVWRLDRLGRSLGHLIQTIGGLEKRGINFRSLTESIDTGSPGGRLVFHVIGAMAEFERALISERTRAGMTTARKRGQHVGRPSSIDSDKETEILKEIGRGIPRRSVALKHGTSQRTIERLLQRAASTAPLHSKEK